MIKFFLPSLKVKLFPLSPPCQVLSIDQERSFPPPLILVSLRKEARMNGREKQEVKEMTEVKSPTSLFRPPLLINVSSKGSTSPFGHLPPLSSSPSRPSFGASTPATSLAEFACRYNVPLTFLERLEWNITKDTDMPSPTTTPDDDVESYATQVAALEEFLQYAADKESKLSLTDVQQLNLLKGLAKERELRVDKLRRSLSFPSHARGATGSPVCQTSLLAVTYSPLGSPRSPKTFRQTTAAQDPMRQVASLRGFWDRYKLMPELLEQFRSLGLSDIWQVIPFIERMVDWKVRGNQLAKAVYGIRCERMLRDQIDKITFDNWYLDKIETHTIVSNAMATAASAVGTASSTTAAVSPGGKRKAVATTTSSGCFGNRVKVNKVTPL
jgi:hypothetical protein